MASSNDNRGGRAFVLVIRHRQARFAAGAEFLRGRHDARRRLFPVQSQVDPQAGVLVSTATRHLMPRQLIPVIVAGTVSLAALHDDLRDHAFL